MPTPRRNARRRADDLFRKLIHARGPCQRCGKAGPVQCAHILGRVFSWTRTWELNAWALCGACHYEVDSDPNEKMKLVHQTIGLEAYESIVERARRREKFDWEAEIARLKSLEAA